MRFSAVSGYPAASLTCKSSCNEFMHKNRSFMHEVRHSKRHIKRHIKISRKFGGGAIVSNSDVIFNVLLFALFKALWSSDAGRIK